MGGGPHTWNIGDDIVTELIVLDASTAAGISGQVPYITLTIRRDSDGKFWNNMQWVSSRYELSVFETDSVNQPGRYNFTLPGSANSRADRYVAYFKVDNFPTARGEDLDVHTSRQQDVKVYESEPL